jgi:predicted nuclease of restriction endonuclease-like (RecB) superfamily
MPYTTKAYITEIKQIIISARTKAHTAINTAMIEAYWLIGKRIIEEEQNGKQRAEYRQEIIKTLSKELKSEFGTGFSERILRDSRRFYLCFKDMEFGTHCMPNLTWPHCWLILPLTDKNTIKYYLTATYENNLFLRTLNKTILILIKIFWIFEKKRRPQCPIAQ